jgi:hypothetical protein
MNITFINNWELYKRKFIVILGAGWTYDIYQYLENKYPEMKKTILTLKIFYKYLQCPKCYVWDLSNKTKCHNCRIKLEYKNFVYKEETKVIVISDYFDHYKKILYPVETISDNHILFHINNYCDIHIVNLPIYFIKKKKLESYISNYLYQMSNISDFDRLFELLKIPGQRDVIRLIINCYLIVWKKID